MADFAGTRCGEHADTRPAEPGRGALAAPVFALRHIIAKCTNKSLLGGSAMPDILFVCLQDEDKIASFAIDAATGELTREADIPVAGGPSVLALSPDRRVLYVGQRARQRYRAFASTRGPGPSIRRAASERRTRRPFSRPTAPAAICYRPITRVDMPPCIRSDRMARSGRRCSTGRTRHRRARDRDRSVEPLRLCPAHLARPGQRSRTAEEHPRP